MVEEQTPTQGAPAPSKGDQASGRAIGALVIGIVGFLFCQPLGIAAFIMGGREKKAIEAGQAPQAGLGIATAGWILGIIDIVLTIIGLIFGVIFLILIVTGATLNLNM